MTSPESPTGTPPARDHPEAAPARGGAPFAVCALAAGPAAIPRLRRFVRHLARTWGLPEDLAHTLGLAATELGTNALRHSGSPQLTLTLRLRAGAAVLSVADTGRWLPAPREAPPEDARNAAALPCGGRGLDLVRSCATRCEIHRGSTGTTVTAVFAIPPPGSGPAAGDAEAPEGASDAVARCVRQDDEAAPRVAPRRRPGSEPAHLAQRPAHLAGRTDCGFLPRLSTAPGAR
ncbi:ATP-binding protein [Streptomyces physcomitrii]|uniref:ATP-binding protein n=1 Tax=Streptomyces physcomitrii TaxID=2724184 RepID=UPI0034192D2C